MEFLEYYRIITGRIWIVIATAAVAAIVVVVYLIIPPSKYEARGRILVRNEAAIMMVRSADSVTSVQSQDFWYTLFQVLESDTVRYRAAREAGINDPRIVENLEPIEGRQLSRSSVAQISADAPGPDLAVELTDAAMAVIREAWDEFRLAHIGQINTELDTVLSQVEEQLVPLEEQMDAYQKSEEAGTPADQVTALEARINTLQGQIQGAEIELQLAQDRVASLRELGPVGTGASTAGLQYGGALAEELRTMRRQLEGLRDQRAAMLEHRTEEHPAIIALNAQIADLQEDMEALRRGEGDLPAAPTPLDAQLLDGQLAVSDARRRIEVLQGQLTEARSQLPVARARAEEFVEFAQEYERLKGQERSILAQFDKLEAEKRRLEQTEDIDILDEAVLQPSGRTPAKAVMLSFAGIIGGAVVGILAILLLHYVDATFKNAHDAARLSGRRVLGAIPRTDIVMAPAAPPAPDEPAPEAGAAIDLGLSDDDHEARPGEEAED